MKNKIIRPILVISFILLFIYCIWYVIKSNLSASEVYPLENPVVMTIQQKSLATGKIIPKEKVDIKPNISGIIKEIYVKEGEEVEIGELIATIRVVPVVSSVNNAVQSISSAQIQLSGQQKIFNRQKLLFNQGVISKQEFENAETEYKLAQQTLTKAKQDYEIARTGVAPGLESLGSVQIRSTARGVVLDLPVEIGDQVIEANTFNAGTTIATVADVSKMIFEGKVDETDAGKMKLGMSLKIIIGALDEKSIDGVLSFISPQGVEEGGTVKYRIKADLMVSNEVLVRPGYSANSEMIIDERKNTIAIKEALLQYDNDRPFVEVLVSGNKFKKVYVELGLSDGLNVEVKNLKKEDKVKVWSETEENKGTK